MEKLHPSPRRGAPANATDFVFEKLPMSRFYGGLRASPPGAGPATQASKPNEYEPMETRPIDFMGELKDRYVLLSVKCALSTVVL